MTESSARIGRSDTDAGIRPGSKPSNRVLIYRDHLGAPSETFILAQAEALQRFDPFFLCSRIVGPVHPPLSNVLVVGGTTGVAAIREAAFKVARMSFVVDRHLDEFRPAVIHAHFGPGGAVVGPFATRRHIPLLVTFHGMDATVEDQFGGELSYTFRLLRRRRAWLQKGAAGFIAVSEFIRDRLIAGGYPPDRVIQHYIGIDLEKFRAQPSQRRTKTVVFVGRLVEKKGCAYLIRAMSEVQNSYPDVSLVVIGDGPLRGELESLAGKLGVRATFLGTQPPAAVREWMSTARVFCVPSVTAASGDAEGFGMVFAEAAALGTPVVSFASGGIPEAVADGKTGLLAPERDVRALSCNLKAVLTDDELFRRLSVAGVARVGRLFDIRKQTAILEAIYHDIADSHKSDQHRQAGVDDRRFSPGVAMNIRPLPHRVTQGTVQAERGEGTIRAVAICIATCGRPKWLGRLLQAIRRQDVPSDVRVVVVVCDNDERESAADIVAQNSGPWLQMLYVHEPRRGIPFARNASVDVALKQSIDAIAFIDDDEEPNPDWLVTLIAAQQRLSADVVQAPVVPVHSPGTADWVIKGRLFERRLPVEGARLATAATNNTLVLANVFRRVGRFDERLRYTGGSDTDFFMRAHLAGLRIRATRDAVVGESVPASRTSTKWLIQRAYRMGNGYVRCEKNLLPTHKWLLLRPMKIAAKCVVGLARLAASSVAGRAMAVRGLQDMARAAGGSAALLGIRYDEYRIIHGH